MHVLTLKLDLAPRPRRAGIVLAAALLLPALACGDDVLEVPPDATATDTLNPTTIGPTTDTCGSGCCYDSCNDSYDADSYDADSYDTYDSYDTSDSYDADSYDADSYDADSYDTDVSDSDSWTTVSTDSESDSSTTVDTDWTTTDATDSSTTIDTDWTTTDATDSGSTTVDTDWTTTDSGSTTVDTDTGSGTDTDTDTDTDTGGEELFPPPGEFGDVDYGVQELDLVGSWSLQWDPENAPWSSELVIDEMGGFVWRETSNNCMTETFGTGVVWVEGSQLVMHVDTWERQLPWDTAPFVDEVFDPPFRLRLGYSLQGTYLALAGPDRLVEAEPYVGRSMVRQSIAGLFLGGEWRGEAELIAVPAGQDSATVVVRDRFITYLDAEQGVDPEGLGEALHDQVYWMVDPPVPGPIVYDGGNWTCLDGCPQPAGATLVNGANLHAYGPYAGNQHLMSFASGRTFKRDVAPSCP